MICSELRLKGLAKIARDAGQEVPDWLAKFEQSKASKAWDVQKAVLS